jgi:hypothetical protein
MQRVARDEGATEVHQLPRAAVSQQASAIRFVCRTLAFFPHHSQCSWNKQRVRFSQYRTEAKKGYFMASDWIFTLKETSQ